MTAQVASMSAVASLGVTVKSASTSALSEGSSYTEDAVSTPITGGIPEGWPVNAPTELPSHLAADAAAADPVVRFTVAEQVKKGEDFHMALANYRCSTGTAALQQPAMHRKKEVLGFMFDGHNGTAAAMHCKKELLGFVFDGQNGTAAAMHCKKELLGFVSEYPPLIPPIPLTSSARPSPHLSPHLRLLPLPTPLGVRRAQRHSRRHALQEGAAGVRERVPAGGGRRTERTRGRRARRPRSRVNCATGKARLCWKVAAEAGEGGMRG
ncbi:unnamed protein product [Closterium sp. NIES-65]|nr:unnamed protein product [Closterium sp. NIES-65]